MTNKIVYVTGCLGFIGSYVTSLCLQNGWYVRGVDKMTYAADKEVLKDFLANKNFAFEKKDINSIDFLYECDYIINCAAETHVGNSIIRSKEFVHSNIDGVYHLLELIKNYRQESSCQPTLLHFSTDEVYGDIVEGSHTETDLLKPSNPYSATKAAADMLILAWARTYNIPTVIVRPTNNYGIGQYIEKLIPKTLKYLQIGKRIPLHQEGKPTRIWLHASDTANAILTLINSNIKTGIWNISGNVELSNIDVVTRIIDSYFGRSEFGSFESSRSNYINFIDFTLQRPGADVRYSLDDSKLKSIGWVPIANFDKEIRRIVSYTKERKLFVW